MRLPLHIFSGKWFKARTQSLIIYHALLKKIFNIYQSGKFQSSFPSLIGCKDKTKISTKSKGALYIYATFSWHRSGFSSPGFNMFNTFCNLKGRKLSVEWILEQRFNVHYLDVKLAVKIILNNALLSTLN